MLSIMSRQHSRSCMIRLDMCLKLVSAASKSETVFYVILL